VLVEDDLRLVTNISDRIDVLGIGRTLAENTAAEMRANPHVVAAYLGGHTREASRARAQGGPQRLRPHRTAFLSQFAPARL
jgi:ABC-type transporter Mla maintaining outer membrane lipid asymmetry ATPase subunit MlaF